MRETDFYWNKSKGRNGKIMKKKKVCVLLSVIMTVVSFSGCGSSFGGVGNAAPSMEQAASSVEQNLTDDQEQEPQEQSSTIVETNENSEAMSEPQEQSETVLNWKEIYSKWIEENENADGSSELWDNKEYSTFMFYTWEGFEVPVLVIQTGAAWSDYNYYGVIDGEVKCIGHEGKAAMGYMGFHMINNTPYCFNDFGCGVPGLELNGEYYDFNYCEMSIFNVHNVADNTEYEIWSGSWYEPSDDMPADWDSDYGTLDEMKISKAEAMTEIDEILGVGVAEWIFDFNDESEGPLSLAQESEKLKAAIGEGEWYGYDWSLWQAALDAF